MSNVRTQNIAVARLCEEFIAFMADNRRIARLPESLGRSLADLGSNL